MSNGSISTTSTCEVVINLAIDGLHDLRHTCHIRIGLQRGVGIHIGPITIVADKSRLISGHISVDDLLELIRERLQNLTLALASTNLLEVLKVGRMHGEQRHIVFQMTVHLGEILGERLQMVSNKLPLLVGLAQHSFLSDELHILLGDGQSAVAVVDMVQHLTCELELGCTIN